MGCWISSASTEILGAKNDETKGLRAVLWIPPHLFKLHKCVKKQLTDKETSSSVFGRLELTKA